MADDMMQLVARQKGYVVKRKYTSGDGAWIVAVQ
jgi:hypothetical protein